MRVAAVGLIILMAVGCGGGSSDSAKIDAAIRTFETGIASCDGQKACAVMSGAYIRDMLSQVYGTRLHFSGKPSGPADSAGRASAHRRLGQAHEVVDLRRWLVGERAANRDGRRNLRPREGRWQVVHRLHKYNELRVRPTLFGNEVGTATDALEITRRRKATDSRHGYNRLREYATDESAPPAWSSGSRNCPGHRRAPIGEQLAPPSDPGWSRCSCANAARGRAGVSSRASGDLRRRRDRAVTSSKHGPGCQCSRCTGFQPGTLPR